MRGSTYMYITHVNMTYIKFFNERGNSIKEVRLQENFVQSEREIRR